MFKAIVKWIRKLWIKFEDAASEEPCPAIDLIDFRGVVKDAEYYWQFLHSDEGAEELRKMKQEIYDDECCKELGIEERESRLKKHICVICGHPFYLVIKELYLTKDSLAGGVISAISGEKCHLWESFDCPNCGCQNRVQERLAELVKVGVIAKLREERDAKNAPCESSFTLKKEEGFYELTAVRGYLYTGTDVYDSIPPEKPYLIPKNVLEKQANEIFSIVLHKKGAIFARVDPATQRTEVIIRLGCIPAEGGNMYWKEYIGESIDIAMALQQAVRKGRLGRDFPEFEDALLVVEQEDQNGRT